MFLSGWQRGQQEQAKAFVDKHIHCRPRTRFYKSLRSILQADPAINYGNVPFSPYSEPCMTEVLSLYYPLRAAIAAMDRSRPSNVRALYERGGLYSHGPLLHYQETWLEREYLCQGQPVKVRAIYMTWRSPEEEKTFKYASQFPYTAYFRWAKPGHEWPPSEDTATYEGFLSHQISLGYDHQYLKFKRVFARQLATKRKRWNCAMQ